MTTEHNYPIGALTVHADFGHFGHFDYLGAKRQTHIRVELGCGGSRRHGCSLLLDSADGDRAADFTGDAYTDMLDLAHTALRRYLDRGTAGGSADAARAMRQHLIDHQYAIQTATCRAQIAELEAQIAKAKERATGLAEVIADIAADAAQLDDTTGEENEHA